jgi:hypothetical protein
VGFERRDYSRPCPAARKTDNLFAEVVSRSREVYFAMVTADWTSQGFPHRANDDGTFDSICPLCFRTVAHAHREEDLAEPERNHVCKPRIVASGAAGGVGQVDSSAQNLVQS